RPVLRARWLLDQELLCSAVPQHRGAHRPALPRAEVAAVLQLDPRAGGAHAFVEDSGRPALMGRAVVAGAARGLEIAEHDRPRRPRPHLSTRTEHASWAAPPPSGSRAPPARSGRRRCTWRRWRRAG